jgi:hypothetical protein
MSTDDRKRKYREFDPSTGYPADESLYYECLRCGDIIPSLPSDNTHCRCRNIMIDIDYGRLKLQDDTQVKMFAES